MMQTELLRTLLFEYLSTYLNAAKGREHLQWANCLDGVAELAAQRHREEMLCIEPARYALREEDGSRLKHVVWDLILGRVLIPGTVSPKTFNDGWPFLSVTDHGRKVLAERKPVPYDPDGYLSRLNQAVGGLHPTVQKYLEEAIATFRTGNYLASAITLGAASEMLFLRLCSAIGTAIADLRAGTKFTESTRPRKQMVQRIAAVTSWLNQKKSQLPTDWQRDEQIGLINKIADLIRNCRNDAGHPQDPPATIAHEEMYALLVVFPDYCEKLHALTQWLLGRPGAIL